MFNLGKREVAIFSFFVFLSLIITYPLIFKMNNSIFSDSEWTFDSLGFIYGLWAGKQALLNNTDSEKNDMVAYPFGIPYETNRFRSCLSPSVLLVVLVLLKNEIFAYNFYTLCSFILSGIFMYYLSFYLTRNKLAAFVSGIIFTFCSHHFLQAFSHFAMAQIQWMPLYVLSLIALDEKRTYPSAIFCGIAFSLVVLMNYYFGYFMGILTAGFILFNLAYRIWGRKVEKKRTGRLKTVKLILLAGIISLMMILPSAYDTIKQVTKPQRAEAETSTIYVRSYDDLYRYAARIYDYFLPTEYHPLFGGVTQRIVKKITGGQRHWAERTLYLGVTPLFLAIIGVMGWRKRWNFKTGGVKKIFIFPFFYFWQF